MTTTMNQGKKTGKDQVTHEVARHLGVVSTSAQGWTREVNLVSWNNRPARLDIRDWSPDHTRMSRGVALNGAEVLSLKKLLSDFDVSSSGI